MEKIINFNVGSTIPNILLVLYSVKVQNKVNLTLKTALIYLQIQITSSFFYDYVLPKLEKCLTPA